MRKFAGLVAVVLVVFLMAGAAEARPRWKRRIDRLVAGHSMGVSVSEAGRSLYRHADKQKRIPASNQKILLSMAALDLIGPNDVIATPLRARKVSNGVVHGHL